MLQRYLAATIGWLGVLPRATTALDPFSALKRKSMSRLQKGRICLMLVSNGLRFVDRVGRQSI